jgi:hypothetical protein
MAVRLRNHHGKEFPVNEQKIGDVSTVGIVEGFDSPEFLLKIDPCGPVPGRSFGLASA